MFALIIPLSGDGGQIDNSLPGGGRPDHISGGRPGRPGGGHIDNTLPEGPQPKGVPIRQSPRAAFRRTRRSPTRQARRMVAGRDG